MTKQIPNLFTLLNLFFGCLAIVFILQNGIIVTETAEGPQYLDIPPKIWYASLFIGLAAVIDFLDGFVARLFKAESAMGKELDSLADVVSFGVAPSMIIYQFLRLSVAQDVNSIESPVLLLVPAFFLSMAAAWRLARFNISQSGNSVFSGMPVPAVGIFIASLPIIYWKTDASWLITLLLNKWFWYGIIGLFSFLMVSSIPLMSMKFKSVKWPENRPRIILLVLAVVSFILLKWLAIPLTILAYVLLSLLFKNELS
jgi:CDP-diacylglycerol--serine O-phosphatidyltransferase